MAVRQHAGPFVVRLVQEFARGGGDDGMDAGLAEMRRPHHRRSVDSIGRLGSERKLATPASVLSASA